MATADRFRLPRHALAGAAAIALALTGLVACGGDDDDAQTLTFSATEKGISGPSSAETGTAEVRLNNEGKNSADLQLIRVEGDRSAQDVIQALGLASAGRPFPDWFFAGGGVGSTPAGESDSVTQVLEPGTYWAFNTESGPPDPKTAASLEVTGETSDEEVEADDGEIQAVDYGFEATGLKAGRNEILFSNTGVQPHHILASPAIGDATAEDAERFFKTNGRGAKPPIQEKGTQSTAVLEGGDSQLVTLDLKPGRYVLYCFISDRQGGPPHALKGMVDAVEVK